MQNAFDRVSAWGAVAFLHLAAVAFLSALFALVTVDLQTLHRLVRAWRGALDPSWGRLALHVGLSGLVWVVIVGTFHLLRSRFEDGASVAAESRESVRAGRGAVMVETLIALVPLLLLTSGIAQLAMVNVASILSDYAAYQGARTAWLWKAEERIGRESVSGQDVEFRARTAAALALAPSAASDYTVGRNIPRGSVPPFRRIRTAIAASFRPGFPGLTGSQEWSASGNNWNYFQLKRRNATLDEVSWARAFDSVSFHLRAARKCTIAWMNLRDFRIVERSGKVGVHFTYKYNLIFPWFAYIFGKVKTSGMRTSHYVEIEREFMYPKQTGLN